MNSRDYYSEIESLLKDCSFIVHFSVDFDEITSEVGYLKGNLDLIDGASLHFNEYFEIQSNSPKLLKYKYHWQSSEGNLIRRWDNARHHKELKTFPHHVHDHEGVHSSQSTDLKKVLDIIINAR